MVVRYGFRGNTRRLRLLRRSHLKQKKAADNLSSRVVAAHDGTKVTSLSDDSNAKEVNSTSASGALNPALAGLSETALRNIALEAVRTGNYYAAPVEQEEVIKYISDVHRDLLADQKWLKKNCRKLELKNGLTQRYTVIEILAKSHEKDGYNVFLDAEEACAAFSAAQAEAAKKVPSDDIMAGTMLLARKDVRIFASITAWEQIGLISAGQHIEVADAPRVVEGFEMVAIRPNGAIETKHLQKVLQDTIVELPTETKQATDELAMGRLAELREGLTAAVAAEDNSNDPIGVDELLELLEGCAALGELGATVYCGERIEALHRDDFDVNLPHAVLDRMFQALKPLLRPGAARAVAELDGPWSKTPSGRAGAPNHRKRFNQLLGRVVTWRKEKEFAAAGDDVQRERQEAAKTEQALQRMSATLATFLGKDAEASVCRRRGPLSEAIVRVCGAHGLTVSSALAFVVIGELESIGVVKSQGRELEFNRNAAPTLKGSEVCESLSAFKAEVGLFEDLAKERLNRRRKRQQAREKGRAAKRKCVEEDE